MKTFKWIKDLLSHQPSRRPETARTQRDHPAPASHVDLEALAIERLASLGTERGSALAMEIERGRQRRQDGLRETYPFE